MAKKTLGQQPFNEWVRDELHPRAEERRERIARNKLSITFEPAARAAADALPEHVKKVVVEKVEEMADSVAAGDQRGADGHVALTFPSGTVVFHWVADVPARAFRVVSVTP